MPNNETTIIKACLEEDRAAQKQLYELYAGKLFVVALRYMKTREEAEDVLQESFIKVFRYLHTFRFDCPLEVWLRRIVINTALKLLKKSGNWEKSLEGEYMIKEDLHYDNGGFKKLSYEQLLGMISELPEGCRVIFNMYAIEGYKHHEIAKELEISEGTSKSQYSRAKQLLQEKLAKETFREERFWQK